MNSCIGVEMKIEAADNTAIAKGMTIKGSLRPTLSDRYPKTGPPNNTPISAAEPIAPVQNTSKSIILTFTKYHFHKTNRCLYSTPLLIYA